MNGNMYRYTLGSDVSMADVQDSLLLAVLAMECIHGSAQASLDLSHEFDPKKRTCLVDATTQVGVDCNRLFTGFLQREFGRDAFRVDRVDSIAVLKIEDSERDRLLGHPRQS